MGILYNLGSGQTNYLKGYVNVDIDEKVNPDIVEDVTIVPWIWAKSNSSDEIRMNNLAEHLKEFIDVVKECHWVLKNKGRLWIKSPFLNTNIDPELSLQELPRLVQRFMQSVLDCCSDPTHKLWPPFTTRTFDYFDCNHSRWQKFGQSYGIPKFRRINQQIKDRFLIVELEAIK